MKEKEKILIVCTPLKFYAEHDEEALFQWIQKIRSIKNYEGVGRELYLYFFSKKLSRKDLLSLMGLFKRYKFLKQDQLEVFMNKSNKILFDED